MLQSLKFLIELVKDHDIFMKVERLLFFEDSSRESNELSLIVHITFQTNNQRLEIHLRLILLLTKEMKILNKDFIILLESMIKSEANQWFARSGHGNQLTVDS